MASNEIVFSVKVQKDGNLKVVAKEAEKAAKSTDNLGKSTDNLEKKRSRYHKAEKGVGQAGLSSAKSFSKMNQTMTGSSGLVGAYAVLAANIFALTAAFGALQRAAQVQQLEEGLRSMGTASGIAMKQLSEGLREATGNALNLEDAMRATALASSAGFDSSSIERLGKVARQASIALGRDTADSLNRLTKGAIKLEPELLDELGIMVRLDEATEAYARSVNKSAGDLTNFEKRQAFMNAVLEEGERKFAAMADVPTNAYDQLAATFQDLTKTLLNFLNKGLLPIINFFAGSQAALFGALVLFGRGIATSMIPALGDLGGGYEKVRKKAAAAAAGQVAQLKNWTGSSKALQKVVKNFDPLNTSQEELNNIQTKANRILKTHTTQLGNWEKQSKKTTDQINAKKVATNEAQQAVNNAGRSSFFFAAAQREEGDMAAVNAAAQGNYKEAISKLGEQFNSANASTAAATKGTDRWTKTALTARNVAGKTALAVRVLGTAFLNMIPIIGQIIFFLGIFWSVGQKIIDWMKSPEQREYEGLLKKQAEANKELAESLKAVQAYNQGMPSVIGSITQKYIALTNVMGTYQTQLTQLNATGKTAADPTWTRQGKYDPGGAYRDMIKAMVDAEQISAGMVDSISGSISKYSESQLKLAISTGDATVLTDKQAKEILNQLVPAAKAAQQPLVNMAQAVKEGNQAFDEFANSLEMKTSVDNVLAGVSNIAKAMKDSGSKSSRDYVKAFQENAGDNMIKLLGLDAAAINAVKYKEGYKGVKKLIEEAVKKEEERLKEMQKTLRLSKIIQAAAKSEIAVLKQRNLTLGNGRKILQEENKIKTETKKQLQIDLDNYEYLNRLNLNDKVVIAQIAAYKAQIANIDKQRATESDMLLADIKDEERILKESFKARKASLDVLTQMVQMSTKLVDLEEQRFTREAEARNRADPMRGYSSALNAQDKLNIQKKMVKEVLQIDKDGIVTRSKEEMSIKDARIQAVENEYNMTLLKNEMERKLLHFRLKVIDAELKAAYDRNKKEGDPEYRTDPILAGMMNQTSETGTFKVLQQEVADAVRRGKKEGLTAETAQLEEQRSAEVLSASGTGDTTAERATAMGEAGGLDSLKHASQKIEAMNNVMGPMIENLKQLGPEGELISAVSQGAFQVAGAWAHVGEVFAAVGDDLATGPERAAAVLGAVSATISSISSLMNASSNARIASIDKEIQAEKKKDGKSKESQEKIKRLEAKKVAAQKKAFEMNKKMQIAQVAINTAAAMVSAAAAAASAAAASGPAAPLTFAAVFSGMGSVIAAIGAATIAVIMGTSFQGGGSAANAPSSGPSNISIGSRGTKSDMAKSRSAAGELAYFRGESGRGGPEDFRGAFYGRRHRAMGGATGYVVGEQGPELFMPDRPGTIVPADDTAAAAGAAGAVTFNINTVDATGVEDLLMEQQGNIIGMIRQAANSYGEEFMEDVDVTAFTPAAVRRA